MLSLVKVLEPTSMYAWWALMHRSLYVCRDLTKIQIGPKVTCQKSKYKVPLQPTFNPHCMYTPGTLQVHSSSSWVLTKAGGLTSTSFFLTVYIRPKKQTPWHVWLGYFLAGRLTKDQEVTDIWPIWELLNTVTCQRGWVSNEPPWLQAATRNGARDHLVR